MPFNSYEFIFGFLPVAVSVFWLLTAYAGRNTAVSWLILVSIAFYLHAGLANIAIIAPSILFDYLLARLMLRLDSSMERVRALALAIGVIANVLFLGYFKYKNFFLDTANTLLATHFELRQTILPLGISFLTFQKIAFLADVHSRQVQAVPFLDFILFTLFFPRTLAGPIVHYGELMPQFRQTGLVGLRTDIAVGICLFSIGLFKKAFIADSLAPFVSPVFNPTAGPSNEPLTLLVAWSGVIAYALQLYFDFSGYSDMATATARLFGVSLPINFNSPFKASSVVEFWSRWHITLTRFLTAYTYTPVVLWLTRRRTLRGRPVMRGKRSTLPAILTLVGAPTLFTMTISGVWHGAGWQFIAWGFLHGVFLTINQGWRLLRPRFWPDQHSYLRVMKPLGLVISFLCVVVALVFFRADSITSAVAILSGIAGVNGILPLSAQILHAVGVNSDMHTQWELLQLWKVTAPFGWLLVLLPAVIVLPNSFELLRRYHPALDFPVTAASLLPGQADPAAAGRQLTGWQRTWFARQLHHLARFGREGVPLGRTTGTIAALLWLLGVIALNRGVGFIYGQF